MITATRARHPALGHLRTVMTHRKWARYYCFKAGLYKRGLTHDLSKYSPTEFLESSRYWSGRRSPIELCKEANGVSYAWLHHRGRNAHHWEYWTDNYESGITAIKVPYNDLLEMFCDYLAAGRTYMGDRFTLDRECEWWKQQRNVKLLHPESKFLMDCWFYLLHLDGTRALNQHGAAAKDLKRLYEGGSILNPGVRWLGHTDYGHSLGMVRRWYGEG